MKLYLAGAMFTAAERQWQSAIGRCLRVLGHEVFVPQENQITPFDARAIKAADVAGIQWAETVIVWLEGPDPDSGTCWEQGYAEGLGKRVVAYTTDLRFQGAANGPYDLNLMMTQGPPVLRFTEDTTPCDVAASLHKHLSAPPPDGMA